jgi:hypothetical protein
VNKFPTEKFIAQYIRLYYSLFSNIKVFYLKLAIIDNNLFALSPKFVKQIIFGGGTFWLFFISSLYKETQLIFGPEKWSCLCKAKLAQIWCHQYNIKFKNLPLFSNKFVSIPQSSLSLFFIFC